MNGVTRRPIALFLLIFLMTLVHGTWNEVSAQIGSGSVSGSVTDPSDAPVPGASVTVTGSATGLVRTTVTLSDGRYVVPGLAPGPYALRIELSGFRPYMRDGVTLATGESVSLDVQLQVGTRDETVRVTANAPILRR